MSRHYKQLMNICHRLSGWTALPRLMLMGFALLLGNSSLAPAAVVSDVRNTNHNLSASGPGTVKATSETQICVFC
ncbi:MAG: hypothetical protein OEV15_07405, partial [Gallionella sp.]|nr:hypothetical protein [Gallionella sp.]